MKIVITGSLGHIGKPLTKELLRNNHQVTVISHSEERKSDIENLGATAAIGSLEDVDFLSKTFTGADSVFCMTPPNWKVIDQMAYYKNMGNIYKHAIRQANVKRVVFLSSWGAHLSSGTGIVLGAHYVENILNELTDVS
ncbi:MAG: NAD(P)H-binding protein, partial [Bacteroidota bacterium]|nr:NAD(P)H-binding protein [Bacteroidota bacterium]